MEFLLAYVFRICVVLLALATVAPFLKVGYWYVRLCDFFRMQIAVLALVLFVGGLVWANRGGWAGEPLVWLAICAAIASWQLIHIMAYTPWSKKEIEDADSSSTVAPTRVVVVNLKVENPSKQAVLDQLSELETELELLLLIETDEAWDRALAPLKARFPYRVGTVRGDGLGLQLWSKLELIEPEVRHLVSPQRASIFAQIRLNEGQLVHFVGVHPLPPGLPEKQEAGRHDSRIRDAELMLVAKQVAEQPDRKWIVTGDFNDVAWSHTTRLFQRISGLRDPRVGRGLYNTYHADYWFLRFPIDQVFISPGAQIHQLKRFRPPGSDHFAILTGLSFMLDRNSDPAEGAVPPASLDDLKEAEDLVEEGLDDADAKS